MMHAQLVFITGATGFIGSQVLEATLKAGYHARVSVRRNEQIDEVKNRHSAFADNIGFCVIPDISSADAFSEPLRDVDHVFHLASPMPGKGEDLRKDYVNPAVKGTEAILQAASEHTTVKTVIVVSSVLGIGPLNSTKLTAISVKDNTNEIIPIDLDADFPTGPAGYGLKYTASKILAHQASRDYIRQKSPDFKLITFHPTFVLGPDLTQTSAETIGGINRFIWTSFGLEKPTIANAWIHVIDVANAFVQALKAGDTIKSGTEFLLSAPAFKYDDAIDYIKKNYPAVPVNWQPPIAYDWHVDTTTAEKLLGIEWKKYNVILDDLFDQQLSYAKEKL